MSFQCSRCGQDVKDENGVLIRGKYYGRDCAARILGLVAMPYWFNGGDWEDIKATHDNQQDKINQEFESRKATMRENWAFIKALSVAFQRARSIENSFQISFLANMALMHGIQFAKETAYLFDDFDSWERAGKYQSDKFVKCELSEKQSTILNKLI